MTVAKARPYRKVGAAGLGGAVGVVIVAILTGLGVDVGAELSAAIATIAAFALGYVVPERRG